MSSLPSIKNPRRNAPHLNFPAGREHRQQDHRGFRESVLQPNEDGSIRNDVAADLRSYRDAPATQTERSIEFPRFTVPAI